MLSLIFGIGVWSFLSGSNFVQYCYLYLVVEDPIIRGAGWNPIYRFNTTTFCACPKPAQEYPTQYVVFFVFYVLRADTVVRFVIIEGLVYLLCYAWYIFSNYIKGQKKWHTIIYKMLNWIIYIPLWKFNTYTYMPKF